MPKGKRKLDRRPLVRVYNAVTGKLLRFETKRGGIPEPNPSVKKQPRCQPARKVGSSLTLAVRGSARDRYSYVEGIGI